MRSALYPPDWTPAFTDGGGRFLHDFSYAGYHNGDDDLPPATGGDVFDAVADYGADATGAADATAAIQSAIDAAESNGGGVVYLPAGLYRCDGTLNVSASNITLRGAGPENTRVFFTQSAGFSYSAHINFTGAISRTDEILLVEDADNRATVFKVADASAFAPGDEVALGWVITEEFVAEHGMTGVWTQFNGQWKPFFRREVLAVNTTAQPNEITLDIPSRYPALVRDAASIRRESGYLSECIVEDLALSNAVDYDTAWQQNQIDLLRFSGVKDAVIRNVESFASPFSATSKGYHIQSGGILVMDSKRVTVAQCTLQKAQNRGSGGNGYLFEVRQSGEVLFRDCVGKAGRHNFIQNWDFGATGIVWLRCHSEGGQNVTRGGNLELPVRADSEYHHSLAMANLVDQCTIVDGWGAGNRGTESSGAGHSATQCVVWNVNGNGNGRIRSFNYGNGYVIGTTAATVYTASDIQFGDLNEGTQPNDFTEHLNNGAALMPQSLYEDQRLRRLGLLPEGEGTSEGEGFTEGNGEGEGTGDGEGQIVVHSADTSGDGALQLAEVLRIIQLYNGSGFGCAEEPSEDGYAIGSVDHACPLYDADYLTQNWIIELSELLRAVQLFNSGGYFACESGEDGYCPAG